MKFTKWFAVLAAVLLALPMCVLAQAPIITSDLSSTTYVTNVQTLAVTTTAIAVNISSTYPKFVVQPTFKLASTGTSNVVFGFQVSMDNGTTYSTTTPITVTAAANGTTSVIAPTIVSTSSVWPVITHLKLASIQNYNGVNVTNISLKYRAFK